MDNYEIIRQVGEGSFGQVFKARRRADNAIVAFKVTRKKGRTDKELVSLRRECEIQKGLSHPNIIRMFDSFETDSKFVVVTEYVEKELYEILGKAGRLSEERSQVIAWDLVSALYYLHSRRIVHRDMKPQNVLVDTNGLSKLCDFGFARLMSQGTHVLMSVKGTPLYMAPELIDELPYDHNVDLWSLGCIVYELVNGVPPFQTSSMRHLMSMIRQADIKWPDHISDNCRGFLQGLLQKDPTQRLTWPDLADHPFVKGRIVIVDEDSAPRALTVPLTASQAKAKQQQFQSITSRFNYSKKMVERQIKKIQTQMMRRSGQTTESESGGASVDVLLNNLSLRASLKSDLVAADYAICRVDGPIAEEEAAAAAMQVDVGKKDCGVSANETENPVQEPVACSSRQNTTSPSIPKPTNQTSPKRRQSSVKENPVPQNNFAERRSRLSDWSTEENEQPIENEEWLVFLQQSMDEILAGEFDSLLQENCVSVFVNPLKNPSANCQVVNFIVCLLSLPYVANSMDKDKLEQIQKVYLETKVVPNLVFAVKLLMKDESFDKLTTDELEALEHVMTLLSRLVHVKSEYLQQFGDAVFVLPDGTMVFQKLFILECKRYKVVSHLVAILNQILRSNPDYTDVAEDILSKSRTKSEIVDLFASLMTHKQSIIRSRGCILLLQLALNSTTRKFLQQNWNKRLREMLEELTGDADESVHDAAMETIRSFQKLPFYGRE